MTIKYGDISPLTAGNVVSDLLRRGSPGLYVAGKFGQVRPVHTWTTVFGNDFNPHKYEDNKDDWT